MLDFRFIQNKLRSFRLRVSTRIKSFYIDLYVERFPKKAVSYPNPSELTPQRQYVLELEKAGKVRQVGNGMWEYIS